MTNFSTNQVMQFYVATGAPVVSDKIPGRGVSINIDGKRTDIIENVLWGKLTDAAALATPVKEVTVAVAGELIGDAYYVVRVAYPEVFGAGVESWTNKAATFYAADKPTAAEVVDGLVAELNAVLPEFLKATDADTSIKITVDTTKLPKWERGFRPVIVPDFNVSANAVGEAQTEGGKYVSNWAKITEAAGTAKVNGSYKLADMEYFALGERGAEYRQTGWPYVNYQAAYKVTPGDAKAYHVLVVHYGCKGDNANSHLSEKDLIVVSETKANLTGLMDELIEKLGATFTEVSAAGAESDYPAA